MGELTGSINQILVLFDSVVNSIELLLILYQVVASFNHLGIVL